MAAGVVVSDCSGCGAVDDELEPCVAEAADDALELGVAEVADSWLASLTVEATGTFADEDVTGVGTLALLATSVTGAVEEAALTADVTAAALETEASEVAGLLATAATVDVRSVVVPVLASLAGEATSALLKLVSKELSELVPVEVVETTSGTTDVAF